MVKIIEYISNINYLEVNYIFIFFVLNTLHCVL